MVYTGVDGNGDQTIGYATASEIDTVDAPNHWARQNSFILSPPQTAGLWASQAHLWNFRDPFVMEDPEDPFSRHLIFYTAKTAADTAHYAIGVARSDPYVMSVWTDLGFYPNTDSLHTHIARLESPHCFPDSIHHLPGQDLQATWRLMFTDGDWKDSSRVVFFESKIAGSPVTDLSGSSWSQTPTPLYDYLHLTPQSPEYGHQGSEMLQIGGAYFWAGFDGIDIRFRKVFWGGTSQFFLTNVDLVAVGDAPAPKAPRLGLAELVPGRGRARFRIDLPGRVRASLILYDVMGRRVRRLVDGELAPGTTEISWDGRDGNGSGVASGIYFVRLIAGEYVNVLRVPLIR